MFGMKEEWRKESGKNEKENADINYLYIITNNNL